MDGARTGQPSDVDPLYRAWQAYTAWDYTITFNPTVFDGLSWVLVGWFFGVRLVPAFLLVGTWFLTQVFSEVGALASAQSDGVAYMAHVGGFLFGMLAGRLFESRERLIQQPWGS